ncbi:MAG: beta-ketoacyl-ACP synthase III [Bacteriovoracaceae bacterium]
MQYKTKILGTGKYLPKKTLTNFDIEKIVDTSDEWIFERTGIKERRISDPEGSEQPSDMAAWASENALKAANLEANDIDLIILSTVFPDYRLPCTTSLVMEKLGMTKQCPGIDISPACSGFVYGVHIAESFIRNGTYKNVLVIGTEKLSGGLNWKDRSTCILFGDGCGAAVLGRSPEGEDSEVLSSVIQTDHTGGKFLHMKEGGAAIPFTKEVLDKDDHYIKMIGRDLFKVATRTLSENAKEAIEKANLKLEDINWMVPHQANIRIIEKCGELLGIPSEKVIVNIHKYGNTSAATIPIAFHEAIEEGKIKRGDLVLFNAFGAGVTSGATVLRY